jgi:hypothetical protein
VSISEPSDGLLHETTQKLPQVEERYQLEAREANHEELLNHRAVTDVYRIVWDGLTEPSFATRIR